jgi:hypothetical protein
MSDGEPIIHGAAGASAPPIGLGRGDGADGASCRCSSGLDQLSDDELDALEAMTRKSPPRFIEAQGW